MPTDSWTPELEKKEKKMFSFYVKSPVSGLSKQHLHEYQAGEAMGYTVDCKDGRFQVNKWCLHNSDFLLTMHKGKLKIKQDWIETK